MDIYKAQFEKGAEHYIKSLDNISWFDNPFIKKKAIIELISESNFKPYFAICLKQLGYLHEEVGKNQLIYVLDKCLEFIPNSSYTLEVYNDKDYLMLTVNGNLYNVPVDLENFEAGEGEDSFAEAILNQILEKENIDYRFYELPPCDETSSLIFVKPQVYDDAVKIGLIPDFLGYFAVNY